MKLVQLFAIIPLLATPERLTAQPPKPGQFVVKAGENVNHVIPFKEKHLYPNFEYGFAYFKDGGHSEELRLNYNKLTSSMNWINAKGDTMAFTNIVPILYIKINDDVFLNDKNLGYLLVLDTKDSIMLACQNVLDIVRKESAQGDGYGNVSQVTASTSLIRPSGTNKFIVNENTVFGNKERCYLIDPKLKVELANKGGFFKMFPKMKFLIQNYVTVERIEFYAGSAPVQKLFQYCASMPK